MDKLLKGEVHPALAGLGQALGLTAYCALVGAFMFFIEKGNMEPGYIGVFLILVLFVFSAAITGSLVFGLPVYLALNNKIKEALATLSYTLLYSFLIILVLILIIFAI
ncbi:MAG: hypothetical protein WD231_00990 [Candidatus Woykebacteria bacterium]